jgi:CHAT domain-containing protein
LAPLGSRGQEPQKVEQESASSSELIRPGIVIEKFDDEYSASKNAGMQEGDVLLSWSRGDAAGRLDSPFDLSLVANDQAYRGTVTYVGLRGTESRKWTVSKQYWGTTIRPNFSDAALVKYRETLKMAEAGQPDASEHWKALVDDPRSARFPWLRAWILGETARLLAQAQHRKESDDAYQQALQSSSSGAVRSQLLVAWGNQLLYRSEWDQAQLCFEQANDSLQEETSNLKAEALDGLATVARGRGDLGRSQTFFSRALEIVEQLEPGSLRVGEEIINLGMALYDRGELVECDKYERRALAIFEKQGPVSVGMAIILNNLADIARRRGDVDRAERYQRKALAIEEKVDPGTSTHAAMLKGLADILEDRGDNRIAEQALRQSIAIQVKLAPGSLDEADGRQGLGDLARNQNDFDGAQEAYLQALAIKEKLAPQGLAIAETLQSLGDVAFTRRDLTNSKSYYQRALTIREKLAPGSLDHANSLAALARIAHHEGQLDEAITYYRQSLDALESQTARLGGGSDVRAGFRAKHEEYYREYIDLLVSQNKPELAFAVLERSRARALLETLAGAHIDIRKGADSALLQREHGLQADLKAKSERRAALLSDQHNDAQIRSVEKEISDLTAELQDVEAQIRSSSPAYAALTQPHPASLDEVQGQLLDRDTALLEYSLGEERSYLWLLTQDSLAAYELPKRSEMEETAREIYRLLTTRGEVHSKGTAAQKRIRLEQANQAYRKKAAILSRMVLEPVAAQIENKRRLLIVSDGALQYIPFAALPAPGSATAGKKKQPAPLLMKHEIVNLPSVSVLVVLRQQEGRRQPARKAVAVLADPVFAPNDPRVKADAKPGKSQATTNFGNDVPDLSASLLTRSVAEVGLSRGGALQLPRLPFSRREADAIMSVTAEGLGLKAVDFDASRERAISSELSEYRIVHFATHGLLDSQHPELSGLVLSLVDRQGHAQDGFLQLQDVYNMNLPADLVVLSACETGLGKEVNGEGLIGLTRGFMYAGATRVVSSLWKVDDFATTKLMKSFYTSMEKERKRPAEALRDAQLSLLKDPRWSSPYYWAGFTIQGEWK